MIGKVEQETPKPKSFLQYFKEDPVEVQSKMEKLGPILDRLKSIDGKAFGSLAGLLHKVVPAAVSPKEDFDATVAELNWPKHVSFLERVPKDSTPEEDPETSAKLEALAPVLDKLRGLDPKSFGMLSGMLSNAEQQK